jgi:prophage regulatory protein
MISENRILKRKEVVAKVGLSYPTINRLEKRKLFPSRLRISEGRVGWSLEAINKWISERVEAKAVTA